MLLKNDVISIDEKRFYTPKVLICSFVWIVMTVSASYFSF